MYRSKFYPHKQTRLALGSIIVCLSLLLMVSVSGVAQAAGTITGHVFRDYNANGVQDAGEPNAAGVTINAYGAGNTIVGTATSIDTLPPIDQLATTNYIITWNSADPSVRLEFTDLPGVAQQGAFGANAGSGTSVQFADAGATVNYGINRPSDYCLATPNLRLVTTCFELGDQTSGGRVVVSHPYTNPVNDTTVAIDNPVGTAWGVAYKRGFGGAQGTVYVSAFAKRQAGYGTGGSGAIYAIPLAGGPVTTLTTIPNAGATPHTAPYATDSTFYDAPGKEGLGDMDISEDGNTLYVVNLNDRQLYSVDVSTAPPPAPTPVAHGVIGNPTCVNGVYRPFGLGIRDGLVYVGGVCTGENAALGDTSGLHAYVYTFDPASNTPSAAPVLDFPLTYPRGCTDADPAYAPTTCRIGVNGSLADWQPWHNTWPTPDQNPPGTGIKPPINSPDPKYFAYPQPILAGIEFVGEDMVVSFRDRMGDQIGTDDFGPDAGLPTNNFPTLLSVITAGDILRAGPSAGGWTLESASAGIDFGGSGGNANQQGPGGGEFYFEDNFDPLHDEIITGGIVQVPGAPEIAAEVFDPTTNVFTAGTRWFSNTMGTFVRGFEIIPQPAPFGKGNGLGDLAALCDSAPIEIGNYVWFDANHDGIQDANEQPLAGIVVTLTDAAGNPILDALNNPITATTDAQGRYIFSSNATGPTNGSFKYGVPFTENTTYQVRIDTTQAALAPYSPTLLNADGTLGDMHDSDGDTTIAPNFVVAPVTIGTAGQNDHTLDFGFFTPPYSLGNRVWFDNGDGGPPTNANNGIQDGTEPGVDGVLVNLLDSTGTVIAQTTTSGGGFYIFNDLQPGTYSVQIPATNFAPGGPLNGFNSSGDITTSGLPDNDTDVDDNGIGTIPDVNDGILSNSVTLGPPGPAEPTTPDEPGGGPAGTATDDHSNITVDFGFVGTSTNYSLGNRVWLDSNNSGTIDAGEQGINNVTLNLYTVTGGVTSPTPLRTTTTTSGASGAGYYLFDNLPAGDYVVEVAPVSCSAGGPLAGLMNSTGAGQEANPNADGDSNDNGLDSTGTCSVRSGIVTLGPGPSEPTGETDFGPQVNGTAANDHSNLTVDFGYFGTPTNPQTPVAPITLDPAITKQVDPAFAQPGDEVRWTITLHNPHAVAINNVGFVDNFPGQLEIIRATVDTTGGSLVVTGNTVTYNIVVINPGQSIHVTVLTRVRIGTPVPFIISNTVNLNGAVLGSAGSASASLLSVGSLPATGFEPPWRAPLLIGIAVLLVLFGIGAVRLRQRGYPRQ